MKKVTTYLFIILIALIGMTASTSCKSKKEGCPMNENTYSKPNKKGKFKKSRTKSGLFPKKMRKKTKVRR